MFHVRPKVKIRYFIVLLKLKQKSANKMSLTMFCHVRLTTSRSRVQEIQYQDYKHHSCLLVCELKNTPDQGNPTN